MAITIYPTCAWCGGEPAKWTNPIDNSVVFRKYTPTGKREDFYCDPCVERFRAADDVVASEKKAESTLSRTWRGEG